MHAENATQRAATPRSTERFARQHDELKVLGKALAKELDTRSIAQDPARVRHALAVFSGKLRIHAAMEQHALYPRLFADTAPEIVDRARRLEADVGPLYEAFFGYLAKWTPAGAIQADMEGFCRETMKQLFDLSIRMRRENEELYPMVDALDERGSSR